MKRKVKVIFGVDDFNPGVADLGNEELNNLKRLMKNFPKLKVTGFCAANYNFIQNKYKRFLVKKLNPFFCFEHNKNALSKNKSWINETKKIKNLSLELHGFSHFNPRLGTAEEFRGINDNETNDKMHKTLEEFRSTNINVSVFAPPGWALNQTIYDFCKDNNIALANAVYNQKKKYFSGEKIKSPWNAQQFKGVKCIPRNIDIGNGTEKEIKNIIKNNGVIAFHAHVKNIAVENGLTKKNLENFTTLLHFIEKNYSPQYKFFNEI
jgi:hypothetical protein